MENKMIVITAHQGKRISLNVGNKTYNNLTYPEAEILIKEVVDNVLKKVLKTSLLDENRKGADILFAVFPFNESNAR